MSRKSESNLLVGLDLGTSKTVAIVADVLADGSIDVVGIGSHTSSGLKKGDVTVIEETTQAIQRAVEEAELMSGCQIHSVVTGISGGHIRSFNSSGVVGIKDKVVSKYDIERAIDIAKAIIIPTYQKILHVIPQEYIVDNQDGIKDPIGMSGIRLEAKVHMITVGIGPSQNIITAIRKAGLEVDDLVLRPLASSLAVLSQDEKELGVCLIDFGAGTCDVSVYVNGSLKHTLVIPAGGSHVTADLAVAFRNSNTAKMEKIKIKYGCALKEIADEQLIVDSEDFDYNGINQLDLAKIIEPRCEELLTLIYDNLKEIGLIDVLGAGLVITGGCSKMQGILELAEKVFSLSARVGLPQNITGLKEVTKNPEFSTGIGLLLSAERAQKISVKQPLLAVAGLKGMLSRVKHWFQGNF